MSGPGWVTIRLALLICRWTIPFSCAAARPRAVWIASSIASIHGKRRRFNFALHGLTFEVGHDDERLPIGLVDLVDRADVGVIKRRGRAGFAQKACLLRLTAKLARGEKLQSDGAAELGVFGLVDFPHPALTQLGKDLVVRNGLADDSLFYRSGSVSRLGGWPASSALRIGRVVRRGRGAHILACRVAIRGDIASDHRSLQILARDRVVGFDVLLGGVGHDFRRQRGRGWCLVPVDRFQVVANILLVVGNLWPAGLVKLQRPIA